MIRLIRFLGALLALFAAHQAMAQRAMRPAGFITEINAEPGDVRLLREGQAVEVQIFTPLFARDTLEMRGNGTLTIETIKDKRRILNASSGVLVIEGELPSGGRVQEFTAMIGDLFRTKPNRNATNLIGRSGPEPVLAIGNGKVQKVEIGMPLWLSWQGGTAPFTIELRGQTASRKHQIGVLASVKSEGREARLTLPERAAGTLTLIVRDAAGLEARLKLLTATAPIIPPQISAASPTPEFARVAQALFLLKNESQAFDLMAASRLSEVKSYPPAAALLDMISHGKRPQ